MISTTEILLSLRIRHSVGSSFSSQGKEKKLFQNRNEDIFACYFSICSSHCSHWFKLFSLVCVEVHPIMLMGIGTSIHTDKREESKMFINFNES